MTPAGVWVVETKSAWLSRRRFPAALRQVAANVERVRGHLENVASRSRPARHLADGSNDSLDADHDWNGEPLKAFGAKKFWSVLQAERGEAHDIDELAETSSVERRVWNLGVHAISRLVTGSPRGPDMGRAWQLATEPTSAAGNSRPLSGACFRVGAAVRAVALFAAVAHARGIRDPAQTGARGLARIASNWLTRA